MKEEVVSEVHHLLEVLNERVNGYQKAIEHADDPEAASLFEEYKSQSIDFENELRPFSDVSPEEAGTRVIGDIWHYWMDLKSALSSNTTESMIGACITGEKAAIRNYNDVLDDEDLPDDLREILSRQLELIEVACENLEQIRDNL